MRCKMPLYYEYSEAFRFAGRRDAGGPGKLQNIDAAELFSGECV
jgi:hypothetical protein